MGVSYIPVAKVGEIAPGAWRRVDMGGRNVIVRNVDGSYLAHAAECPHEAADLGDDGDVTGTALRCNGHNYEYDLQSGTCIAPADGPALAVLPVDEHDGEVCIRLEW